MNEYSIREESPGDSIESYLKEEFDQHSRASTGLDGSIQSFAFVAYEEEEIIAAIVAKTFWGGLHIKNLFVSHEYRGKGIATNLIEKAFQKGRILGCRFAYVETLSFQAFDFYKKLGFVEEFSRQGYDQGCSFHYLRKDFTQIA